MYLLAQTISITINQSIHRHQPEVEKEYQAGQESFTRLNEAQRDFVTAESRHIRAATQLQLARQTLETILFANP